MSSETSRKLMDGETAVAFAGEVFEKLHPRESWPEWFRTCAVPCYSRNRSGNYVVSIAVTLKTTRQAESVFEVEVNAATAETEVLLDEPLDKYEVGDLIPGPTT